MSNRPDPITLEHFPKSRGVRLGSEVYNARGLARMIEQGGAWSRLVPHTRVPLTDAQIERIMRLAGMHQPPAPAAPARPSRSAIRGTRFGPPRPSPRPSPRRVAGAPGDADARLHLRLTARETYPSRTLVPFADGRSHPEDTIPRSATHLWALMDQEYENYMVAHPALMAQMRERGPLEQGAAVHGRERRERGPMGQAAAELARRLVF